MADTLVRSKPKRLHPDRAQIWQKKSTSVNTDRTTVQSLQVEMSPLVWCFQANLCVFAWHIIVWFVLVVYLTVLKWCGDCVQSVCVDAAVLFRLIFFRLTYMCLCLTMTYICTMVVCSTVLKWCVRLCAVILCWGVAAGLQCCWWAEVMCVTVCSHTVLRWCHCPKV